MPPRRRVPAAAGLAAVQAWRDAVGGAGRSEVATAGRYTLEELAARAPGRSVEVRVPPFGAVQCGVATFDEDSASWHVDHIVLPRA